MTLVVAGYVTIDVAADVARVPGVDERLTATAVRRTPGGMAANCACAAARLGSDVRFFGGVGTGSLGDESLQALAACGVDASGVTRRDGGDALCLILVVPDGGRTIVSQPIEFDWGAADEQLAEGARGFHVDGYRFHDALDRAGAARRRGIVTSIDVDGIESPSWPLLVAAADSFSVMLLNRGVVTAAGVEPQTAVEGLVAAGAEAVAVTLGGDGAIVASSASAVHCDATPVEVRDTTGAGDVFAGAFLHRYLLGAPAEDAARFANAAAALSTTAVGARGFVPTHDDVAGLLERTPAAQEVPR